MSAMNWVRDRIREVRRAEMKAEAEAIKMAIASLEKKLAEIETELKG